MKGINVDADDFADVWRVASREYPRNRQSLPARKFEDAPVTREKVIVIESERGVRVLPIRVRASLIEKQVGLELGNQREGILESL